MKHLLKFKSLFWMSFAILAASLLLAGNSTCEVIFHTDKRHPASCNRISSFKIIIPTHSLQIEIQASNELQKFLKRCSGVVVSILDDSSPPSKNEIVIGLKNVHNKTIISPGQLTHDGFYISTNGKQVIIAGRDGGQLFGSYRFLEQFLGCKMLSSDVVITPTTNSIWLPSNYVMISNPAFEYRYNFSLDGNSKDYLNWHGLNSIDDWGMFGHTYNTLIPAKSYFKKEPNYYALWNGRRTPAQLNPTNRSMAVTLIHNLDSSMRLNPGARFWSVSQNDTSIFCQCDSCRQLNFIEKTPQAANLELVNKVAASFPLKTISTLAYAYSRKPPLNLITAFNVNIVLSDIECRRDVPIERDSASVRFRKDLSEWSVHTRNIMLWDYVCQFNHFLDPFPNLYTLKPNLLFFKKAGVKMVFEEGNYQSPGELSELRSYILSKLLWNPHANVDTILQDFLLGYYGPAAPYIKKYIKLLHANTIKSGIPLGIYDNPIIPDNTYLSSLNLTIYEKILTDGESKVKYKPVFLKRVKACSLPLEYAFITQAIHQNTLKNGVFIKNNSGKFIIKPGFATRVQNFVRACNLAGVTRMRENGETPNKFLLEINQNVFRYSQE